jgi:phosphate transport system substrate-binding protein
MVIHTFNRHLKVFEDTNSEEKHFTFIYHYDGMLSRSFIQSGCILFLEDRMAASVSHNWRAFSISTYINIVVLFLVFSACNQTTPSSPTLSGHLLIVGSTALQPLTSLAATEFEKDHPQAHIEVRGGGSLFGLDAVTSQQADIGESDVYADPTLYADPNLTDHIIGIVPFSMIVHPDVPLSSLTQQDIVDIFTSEKPHNWSEFGGGYSPIVPVVRSDASGTRASFSKYVLEGASEQKNLLQTDSSSMMLQVVTHTRGAIGYIALPALDTNVHTLAINGQTATAETISAGKYPFWGYEHMYTMSNNKNPLLTAFLQFMLTSTVQEQAKGMRYIPLTEAQLPTKPSNNH